MRTKLEKRDCARFYHEGPVVVEKCGTGLYYEARMYNYSLQGMYLESDLALSPGTRVNLWLSRLPAAVPRIPGPATGTSGRQSTSIAMNPP